jgi:hypothetical protein
VVADLGRELVIYVIVIVVVRSILGLIFGSRSLYPALLFVGTHLRGYPGPSQAKCISRRIL